jgi:hypothetical protein
VFLLAITQARTEAAHCDSNNLVLRVGRVEWPLLA